jgi:hypothetical protein
MAHAPDAGTAGKFFSIPFQLDKFCSYANAAMRHGCSLTVKEERVVALGLVIPLRERAKSQTNHLCPEENESKRDFPLSED